MQTSLTLDWADGSYEFKLPWTGCAEIERKSNAGIQAIYERVMLASAYSSDVVEIIRQGLLGGSGGEVDGAQVETTPALVNQLLDRYVTGPDKLPFADNWNVAKAVLHVFMVGHEDAQKKSEGADAPDQTTESTPPKSSQTAP